MFPFMRLVLLLPHGRFCLLYLAFSVTYLRLPWTLCSLWLFAFSLLIFRFLVAHCRNDWGQSLFQLGGDDETAYTLDTYPGHFLDTCNILHWFFKAFLINIQLFQHSLVYFNFLTYEWYHMLISQPLRPITNHIAVRFTFIPSFLPSAYHITGDWGIFAYITWLWTIIVMHY